MVIIGVKQPSITSKWRSGTPVPSRRARSAPSAIRSAVRMPTLSVGARLARRSTRLDGNAPAALLVAQRLVQVVRLLGLHHLVDDRADGLDHRDGRVGLEDVASHVHAGGALGD